LPQRSKIIQTGVGAIGGRAQAPTLGDESEIESTLKELNPWAAMFPTSSGVPARLIVLIEADSI
jgi:hypothetical protein